MPLPSWAVPIDQPLPVDNVSKTSKLPPWAVPLDQPVETGLTKYRAAKKEFEELGTIGGKKFEPALTESPVSRWEAEYPEVSALLNTATDVVGPTILPVVGAGVGGALTGGFPGGIALGALAGTEAERLRKQIFGEEKLPETFKDFTTQFAEDVIGSAMMGAVPLKTGTIKAKSNISRVEKLAAKELEAKYPQSDGPVSSELNKLFKQNLIEADRLKNAIPGLEFSVGSESGIPSVIAGQQGILSKTAGKGTGARNWKELLTVKQNIALGNALKTIDTEESTIYNTLQSLEAKGTELTNNEKIAKDVFKSRVSSLQLARQKIISEAEKRGEKFALRIDALPTKTEQGISIGEHVATIKNSLVQKQNELYDKIPVEMETSTYEPLLQAIRKVSKEDAKITTYLKDIPEKISSDLIDKINPPTDIKELLTFKPPVVKVGELRALDSSLGELQRKARSAGDHNTSRRLGEIRDGVLKTYEEGLPKEVQKSVSDATKFTRETFSPLFRHEDSPFTMMETVDKAGGLRTPEATRGSLFIQSGDKGVKAAQKYKAVFGDDKLVVGNYAKSDLLEKAYVDGKGWSVGKAENWLNSKQQGLKELGLYDDFRDVVKTLRGIDKEIKQTPKITQKFIKDLPEFQRYQQATASRIQFEKSAAGKALGGDPERVLEQAMKATGGNPGKAIEQLIDQIGPNDKQALNGLRSLMKDKMIAAWSSKASPDMLGQKSFLQSKVDNFLTKWGPGIEKLYSEEERKTLQNVRDSVTRIMLSEKPLVSGSPTAMLTAETKLSNALNLVSMLGTRGKTVHWVSNFLGHDKPMSLVGSAAGAGAGYLLSGLNPVGIGAGAVAGQMVVKNIMNPLVEEVLSRAYFDPQYAKLIRSGLSMAKQNIPVEKISSHLYRGILALGIKQVDEDNEKLSFLKKK